MIHPTAIIDSKAEISDSVSIGPFCVIGPDVVIGQGSVVESHVVIKGPTSIGARNHIFQFSTVGEAPSDLKYQGELTELHIGDDNIIRENVTIHRGTIQDKSLTKIGNHNLFMASAHIAHDCVVGNHTIFVNNASLAGHVLVGDWAILGGYALVHPFCKIGPHSFTSTGSNVFKDVPAYFTVAGAPARAKTINSEGLRRRGFDPRTILELKRAYKIVCRQGLSLNAALQCLEEIVQETPSVTLLMESLRSSKRGIIR